MLNYVTKVAKQGVANHSTVGLIVGGKKKLKTKDPIWSHRISLRYLVLSYIISTVK